MYRHLISKILIFQHLLIKLGQELEINKNAISITCYRAYMVFQLLLSGPKTKEELMHYFETDGVINKKLSTDVLNFDLNTLKNIGCKITKPLFAKK